MEEIETKDKLSKRDVCDLVQHAKWLGRKQMGSKQRVVMKTVKLLCPEYLEILEERYGPNFRLPGGRTVSVHLKGR